MLSAWKNFRNNAKKEPEAVRAIPRCSNASGSGDDRPNSADLLQRSEVQRSIESLRALVEAKVFLLALDANHPLAKPGSRNSCDRACLASERTRVASAHSGARCRSAMNNQSTSPAYRQADITHASMFSRDHIIRHRAGCKRIDVASGSSRPSTCCCRGD